MENEHEVFDGISTLTVSQTVVNNLENENDPLPSNPDEHVFDAVFDLKCDITEPCSEVENNSTVSMVDAGNENIRFLPPVSDKELQHLINSHENANTREYTVRVFEAWRENRNTLPGAECVKELHDMTFEEINYFSGRFVIETRTQDGQPYPPRTLYLLTCGLLRHLRDKSVFDKNFLCTKSMALSEFQKILDARMSI